MLICLLAAPAALAGKASQRPLRRSAVAFNECCKGSDIDMSKFLHAGKQFCELAAQFGRFAFFYSPLPSLSHTLPHTSTYNSCTARKF